MRLTSLLLLLLQALALAPSARAQRIRLTTLLGESAGLVAPVIVAIDRSGGTEWRGSVTGWTVSGAYTRNVTPQRAWLAQLDLTPINARLSNRQFVDGELIDSLRYQNASVQLSGGLRFTPRARWTTDVRGVVLHEIVDDLPAPIEAFWDKPYVGLDVTQRYERVRADDLLRTRIEGMRVVARAQAFAGEGTWGLATLAATAGHRRGRVHWRGGTTLVQGSDLNTVSAYLTSGSWDATGASSVYGYAQGEFRVERAAIINTGIDVRVHGTTELGLRAAALHDDTEWRSGAAVNLSTVWRGFVMQAGVAAPTTHLDRPLITASLGWMRMRLLPSSRLAR